MGNTIDELIDPVDSDQLEMNHRIHPLLDEFGASTVWAIQESVAHEECEQGDLPPKPPKPIREEVTPEEHVVKLLRFALEYPEEERAERLANLIGAILEGDENYQVYHPVFLDYFTKRKYNVDSVEH